MTKAIKLEILRTLNRCGSYVLAESRLLDSVRIGVKPEPLAAETKAAIRELEAQGLIVAGRNSLDNEPQWKLTASGKATLSENE